LLSGSVNVSIDPKVHDEREPLSNDLDSRLGQRVKREVEIDGLDLTLHGEAVQ
jgi:hypothetical protein